MPRIRDILPAILTQRSAVIDQALSTALPYAHDDEMADLGQAMLNRGKANGVESLVSTYHRLPVTLRQGLVERAEQFATSIRRAAGRSTPAAANALTIIEQSGSARLAYLVTALCRHSEARIRQQAGQCINQLAQRAMASQDTSHPPHLDAVSAGYLVEAIEQAVVLYSRHQHPALLSAMFWLLPRPMPEAAAALSQTDHPAVKPLNQLLTDKPSTASRRALLILVGTRQLADACRGALAQAKNTGTLDEVLTMGHFLALPATRQALKKIPNPQTHWPDAQQLQQMPGHARRWLAHYLHAISPEDPQEQVICLAALATNTDTQTRLAVLRRLLALAKPKTPDDQPAADNAKDTLALLTRDPEPSIARTALWHLIQADYAGLPRILADLVNSRHTSIRRVAAKQLAPLGFDRFWKSWPKLDPKRRIAAGRALIKIDNDFHRHLASRLASREPSTRIRALVIIAALNQGTFFEDALLELCTSEDEKVVASAVKALSGCTSDAAQQTLQLVMEHDDTRIRANALEALSHTQAAANLDKLLDIAQDEEQRPRANAIKALLELRAKDALPSLTRMLGDNRATHRISALWLIDELGVLQLARLVAEMSLNDSDEQVKQRAGRVIQHLIEDLDQQAHGPSSTRDPNDTTEAA
ncbi:MAG: HEAT repeat domain-containing protein [Phycisphaeraceae bacterium]|nr:HEAT repeat domain-containing protein [Phycisphaeraceae bacterium]